MSKILLAIATALVSFSAFAAPLPILIISGMKDEADVVREKGIVNVIGAENATQLRAKLKNYNAGNVRAVVSFGVIGGLDPKLQAGDLIIADAVIDGHESTKVSAPLTASIRTLLKQAGVNSIGGTVIASDQVGPNTPADRLKLFKQTGAIAVDMESHIAAEFATANHLPLLIVRSVSDPQTFTLPPAALLPLKPDGTPDNDAINKSIAAHPEQIGDLITLNGYLHSALDSLASCQSAIDFGNWTGIE